MPDESDETGSSATGQRVLLVTGLLGAGKTTALKLYAQGLKLYAQSASGLTEYANGLVMLEGDAHAPEADRLYRTVAAMAPVDAVQWLQVEMARADLADT